MEEKDILYKMDSVSPEEFRHWVLSLNGSDAVFVGNKLEEWKTKIPGFNDRDTSPENLRETLEAIARHEGLLVFEKVIEEESTTPFGIKKIKVETATIRKSLLKSLLLEPNNEGIKRVARLLLDSEIESGSYKEDDWKDFPPLY